MSFEEARRFETVAERSASVRRSKAKGRQALRTWAGGEAGNRHGAVSWEMAAGPALCAPPPFASHEVPVPRDLSVKRHLRCHCPKERYVG
jgi:hypothetical protein